jgi:hypothetical protein
MSWAQYTRGDVREKVIGGTHYSLVQSPLIETILADL